MVGYIIAVVFVIILILIFFNKNNNYSSKKERGLDISYILDENAEIYKQNPSLYQIQGLEFIDSCDKNITYPSNLLRDLYGAELDNKIVMYNKNDELLYNNRWISIITM